MKNRCEAHERLVDEVILTLSKTGFCRVWRQPTGAAYRDDRLVHYGVVGSADISGLLRNGRRLEIEVKTGRGAQTDRQKAFERMITAFGGLYIVARDVPSTLEKIKTEAADERSF